VRRLVAAFRNAHLPIFFTGTGTGTGDGKDLPGWLRGFDDISRAMFGSPVWPRPDEPDWQIEDSLAPLENEVVVNKTTADAFASTDLDRLLRERGVSAVVVCGLTTDVCTAAAARGAADRDYQVVMAGDACTTLSEELHRATLEIIGLAFGRVAFTDEIVRDLARVEMAKTAELVPAK
jgi:nicotinamidase-related amidase